MGKVHEDIFVCAPEKKSKKIFKISHVHKNMYGGEGA